MGQDITIPTGSDVMQAGQHVLVVSSKGAWDDIEEMLGNGKMEIKNLAAASAMFAQGQVGPEKLLEQIARAVQANLSNNDIAEVKNFLAQGISGSGGQPSTGGGMRGDPGKPSAATGAM